MESSGIGLAVSGGGFRATLFHLGSLWRLNEFGWLPKLNEITSVSGGSIIAGLLGLRWKKLAFDENGFATNFKSIIVNPVCEFCSRTIDIPSFIKGVLLPFSHPSDYVISSYKKYLYGDATLQDLPSDNDGPRFTIYATSMQTGASVRFARPYMAEYHIGLLESPDVSLAHAVAASSAFPPVLCPVILKQNPDKWKKPDGADLYEKKKLRSRLYLVDGGVYDNLGLERVWDTYRIVLVSDAGAPFDVKENPRSIKYSQISRTKRTLDIISEQTRALRKRKLIDDYNNGVRTGTYWGISSHIDHYNLERHDLPGPMVSDNDITASLKKIRTRLNRFSKEEQGRLINWGYALTDAAMRRFVIPRHPANGRWPIEKFAL